MRYNGSLHRLLAVGPVAPILGSDEALPEIQPGAFAAWDREQRDRAAHHVAAGDACLTPDGRPGRVVQLVDDGGVAFVCVAV
jgi:hypothetical protein